MSEPSLHFLSLLVFAARSHGTRRTIGHPSDHPRLFVNLVWSLRRRNDTTSCRCAQGGFEKKLKKIAPVFGPSKTLQPLVLLAFPRIRPPSKPLLRPFAGKIISPAAPSPPRAAHYFPPAHPPRADPPPSRPPTHCALRHLSQYVTQRATSARRARVLPLCTFPAIARYVTYSNM